MLITKEYLKSLNPCEDRYRHYLDHYKDWSGTLEQFLDLEGLTHEDKKWVFVRSIDKDNLRFVAADLAERVLYIYENKYPSDDRPRKAIKAARSGSADAAYAAARAAADAYAAADAADAAYAAARAAADAADAAYAAARAAAYAARAAAYAAYAAYADAAYAAYAARAADAAYADAAYADATAARLDEENAQLEIMKKYAREALKESDEKT
jgi:hypothetical protein